MINIEEYKTIIKHQSRGEDVRDAFTKACEEIASGLLPSPSTTGYVITVNSFGKWEAMPWI